MAKDLNLKKSWNPALVKNQQKVWELEQKKLKDYKDYKEKKHEHKQEQEYLQLLKLQYGENFTIDQLSHKEKLKVSKLSWMYEDVPFENLQETTNSSGFIESNLEFTEGKTQVENMLQGKTQVGNSSQGKSRHSGSMNERIHKIIGVGKSKSNHNPSSSYMSDDPLVKMKQDLDNQRRKRNGVTKPSSSRRHHRHHQHYRAERDSGAH
ncbi:CWC25 [Candida oxycetoniae]|uniref:Pre-mRNA-splicing factor CWC25 n=1 Tax=Candida oxycetoniae TaxID=497107 RepID=A0AAI9SUV2_9ASCO|nr:CWC25 [Candida oxycetoniae]KAI3403259.2 CWC25 [Candida oxycetoniae]